MEKFDPYEQPSKYAESVIEDVAERLLGSGVAHDTGDNCVYFNDTGTKETYCIRLMKCEHYEG